MQGEGTAGAHAYQETRSAPPSASPPHDTRPVGGRERAGCEIPEGAQSELAFTEG